MYYYSLNILRLSRISGYFRQLVTLSILVSFSVLGHRMLRRFVGLEYAMVNWSIFMLENAYTALCIALETSVALS